MRASRAFFIAGGIILAALFLAGGCRTPGGPGSAPLSSCLVDSFEGDRLWTLESADNHGTVEYTERNVTDGRLALLLRFFDNGRGKTIFRREVNFNLSGAGTVWLDVFNHNEKSGVSLALAFIAARGEYFETRAVALRPGRNADLAFDLGPRGWKDGTRIEAWNAARDSVTRVMMLVTPGGNPEGTLTVDNLRVDRPGVDWAPVPQVVTFTPPPAAGACFRPVELTMKCSLSPLKRHPLKPGDKPDQLFPVDLQARLIRPDGERLVIGGFLKERDDAGDTLTYAVRFRPDVPGPWEVGLGFVARNRWTELARGVVTCVEEQGERGMISVSRTDRRSFAFASGERFFPIGQNVCWAADYEPYLEAMRQYGGNFVRVWICPWNNPILAQTDLDRVNLDSAAAVDRILVMAAEKGIYVQLVLAYHGSLQSDWDRNPFNRRNGGPCALRQDFWVDRTAQQKFKQYLEYAVRRWSSYPNLFAWELMNEASLTPRYDDMDIVLWHREMADHLKRIDPCSHLVTSSLYGETRAMVRIWEIPAIDFVTFHRYGANVEQIVQECDETGGRMPKPYWIQEVGRSGQPAGDQADPEGRHLHHSLWLSWMSRAAGLALPWWWDTHIEPNRLQGHFAAVARFDRGEEGRGEECRVWDAAIRQKGGSELRVRGLIGRNACYGFVYDPERIGEPGERQSRQFLGEGSRLTVRGLPDGEYRVEFWDTYAGEVTVSNTVKCAEGQLGLDLPARDRDFAFKIKRSRNVEPGVTVE
jgi:hypothetical protein